MAVSAGGRHLSSQSGHGLWRVVPAQRRGARPRPHLRIKAEEAERAVESATIYNVSPSVCVMPEPSQRVNSVEPVRLVGERPPRVLAQLAQRADAASAPRR